MSHNNPYKVQVLSCFDADYNVPTDLAYMYRGDTTEMNSWKTQATDILSRIIHLYDEYNLEKKNFIAADSFSSAYSLTSRKENKTKQLRIYSKEELDHFAYALNGCIPLFGNLYQDDIKSGQHCWCPLCPCLSGWRATFGLGLISESDLCHHSGNFSRRSILSHLSYKKNDMKILHELALNYFQNYSHHFTPHISNYMKLKSPVMSSLTINSTYFSDVMNSRNDQITPLPPSQCASPATTKKARGKVDHKIRSRVSTRNHLIYYYTKNIEKTSTSFNRPDHYDSEFDSNLNSPSASVTSPLSSNCNQHCEIDYNALSSENYQLKQENLKLKKNKRLHHVNINLFATLSPTLISNQKSLRKQSWKPWLV